MSKIFRIMYRISRVVPGFNKIMGRLSENSKVENANPKYSSYIAESGAQSTANSTNSSQKWGTKATINRVLGQPVGGYILAIYREKR